MRKSTSSKNKILQADMLHSLSAAAYQRLRNEVITNFITNFFFNALCAWLIQRKAAAVPTDFWNVLLDLMITSFCVCNLTTFFSAAAAKRYKKAGIFTGNAADGNWLCDLPRSPLFLGACLTGLTGLPFGVFGGLGFTFLHVPSLPLAAFVLYKGIYGGILGAFVCAFVMLRCQIPDKITTT